MSRDDQDGELPPVDPLLRLALLRPSAFALIVLNPPKPSAGHATRPNRHQRRRSHADARAVQRSNH